MTTAQETLQGDGRPAAAGLPWGLWRRQIGAILRLEARKNFLGRRAVLLYLAALAPVAAMAVFALMLAWFRNPNESIGWAVNVYGSIYQVLILRMMIFFGCLWVFMNLFRGEVLDRSLHYYLLAPVRREVLVAGKYLSGVIATVLLFGLSTAVSFLLLYPAYGTAAIRQHLLGGPGLGHLGAYLGITALGCVGYGAVFMLVGLFLRNPILPAVLLFLWEGLHFILPALLKRLTVTHYLKSLFPVPLSEGPFALVVEPPPAWVAIGGLLLFSAVAVVLSALRLRRFEIDYGED
jgi:ABC-type transport system involved in multi-copper enzyme maturation permease subunit